MSKFFIVDGNSLLHRAFHAYPQFQTKKGELVNAIYGFSSMLFTLLLKEKPDYIVVAWDHKKKNFRHDQFKEYKANRVKPPEGLYEQLPRLKQVIETLGIPMFEQEGFEADDLIATLAERMRDKQGITTYAVTSDRDALQLIDESTHVLSPKKGFNEYIIYTPKKVHEDYGIRPDQVVDYKGLRGDSSDNIPGVRGIGEKTAIKLLNKYGSIEGIYENLSEMKGAVQKKLEQGKKEAIMSKKLAQLIYDVPIDDIKLDLCEAHSFDRDALSALFEELEFKSLIGKLRQLEKMYSEKKQEKENLALPLNFE